MAVFAAAGCDNNKAGERKEVDNQNEIASFAIADPTGDWGFPSPYAHYSRGPGYVRMSFIFDTLIWKDDKGFIPALAEKWEYLPEENAYVFNLRQNATWHDGKSFTANDVVFTYNYMQDHPYQWVDLEALQSVEALDDYRVKVVLAKPYAPFLDYVGGTLPILPEHIWKNVPEPWQFREKEALVGTGPFKLADYNKEQGTYRYEAFDEYYLGKPKVRELKFVKISSEMTAHALRQKQVDLARVPPELAEDLNAEGFTILTGSHDWVAKLMLNHQKEPLSKKELRWALAYAVDRQALVDTVLRGHGIPAGPGLVPSDNEWYNAGLDGSYPTDPAKTEELLAGLGYTKNGDYYEKDGRTLELELLVSSGGSATFPRERVGEMIKSQLEQHGIKVNMRSLEAKTLDNRVAKWQFDMALSGHGGLGGDPKILNRVITGSGFNSARYTQDQELNQALQKQLAATDPDERLKLVGRIQEVHAEALPCLPLYHPTWYYAHSGKAHIYYTFRGVAIGVPIPMNKMSFVR
ncbi:MAG: ABC transporter substrate-binding protein [Firmicutes bacterium]|nr:ABC transporter substrate-binding protein [Bacillota bacterium]